MRGWMPWALLAVLIVLVAAAPWRRVDPKHEFIVNLLSNLGSEDSTDQFASANGKADTLGHWIGSGRHHGTGSSHV